MVGIFDIKYAPKQWRWILYGMAFLSLASLLLGLFAILDNREPICFIAFCIAVQMVGCVLQAALSPDGPKSVIDQRHMVILGLLALGLLLSSLHWSSKESQVDIAKLSLVVSQVCTQDGDVRPEFEEWCRAQIISQNGRVCMLGENPMAKCERTLRRQIGIPDDEPTYRLKNSLDEAAFEAE